MWPIFAPTSTEARAGIGEQEAEERPERDEEDRQRPGLRRQLVQWASGELQAAAHPAESGQWGAGYAQGGGASAQNQDSQWPTAKWTCKLNRIYVLRLFTLMDCKWKQVMNMLWSLLGFIKLCLSIHFLACVTRAGSEPLTLGPINAMLTQIHPFIQEFETRICFWQHCCVALRRLTVKRWAASRLRWTTRNLPKIRRRRWRPTRRCLSPRGRKALTVMLPLPSSPQGFMHVYFGPFF